MTDHDNSDRNSLPDIGIPPNENEAAPATPARMGRIPIGGRVGVCFTRATEHGIRDIADQYGQRRFGAIMRIAIRRILQHPPDRLATLVAARPPFATEGPPTPVYLGEDLRDELDRTAHRLHVSRPELIRLAADAFLADLAAARRRGRNTDLTQAVHTEIYRGTNPNRRELIRRRESRERNRKQGSDTP